MYIAYDIKGGVKYAKVCSGRRIDGKVVTSQKSLGRVIDEARGIYHNREYGFFTYDLETGEYTKVSDPDIPPIRRRNRKERLILDFGDAWFIDAFIKDIGLWDSIGKLSYGNSDTVRAMVMFYVLCSMANCHAEEWYDGSYARILYPNANLSSQRLSDMLSSIGEEYSYREFFACYFRDVVGKRDGGEDILIDSTGLPNSIHFPLTAISNHNGKISNEVRLIYVTQRGTNLPIYFRYVPGNVVDVSTLTRTMKELKAYNIDTKFAILDAGYLTAENTRELYDSKVSFISRMSEKLSLYSSIVDTCLPELERDGNLFRYNDRYIYIIRKKILLSCGKEKDRILGDDETVESGDGNIAYAYLGRDINMQHLESSKAFLSAQEKGTSLSELHEMRKRQGLFVLYSSRPIKRDDVLPIYYTRQQIEQVFDVCKNNTKMLPVRTQSEETFRGHLVLSFIASVIVKMLQEKVKDTSFNPESMLLSLRNQKCKVFDDKVITCEFVRNANLIAKMFKYKVPVEIPIKS